MFRFIYAFFAFLVSSVSLSLHAKDPSTVQSDAPQRFEIGISMSIPPWVIKETDSGIELDILRASLDPERYDIRPVYVPFERAYKLFDDAQLDAVMNAKANVVKSGYLSQAVVTFQNYAISLASKNYPEDISMSFLQDKTVVGFQKAKDFLGKEYAVMARTNRHYQEVPKQDFQINLLFIRELDFIVMDKSIFGYYWYKANQGDRYSRLAKQRFSQKVRFHPLFKPSHYPFLFRDKLVRDDFDRGLSEIKSSGRYQEILDKYDHLSNLYQH